jgi:hypothetical protein
MGVSGLDAAHGRGAPLIDVRVKFRDDVDAVGATKRINATFDDFHLHPRPWYDQRQVRVGSATKEALERLFGWRLKRVPLERYDVATGAWGHWPDVYRWEEVCRPELDRSDAGSLMESIEMSQPGADDNGQWWS